MKLIKLDPIEFDNLIKAEPDANLYHTAVFNKYKELECDYLSFVDDNGFYCGFAIMHSEKRSLFKKESVCDCGYFINYYDDKDFSQSINLLKKYLKKNRINKFTISPLINFKKSNVDYSLIESRLKSQGFSKIKDNSIFFINLSLRHKTLTDAGYCMKKVEDFSSVEINGYDLNKMKEIFNGHLHVLSFESDDLKEYCILVDYLKTLYVIYDNNDLHGYLIYKYAKDNKFTSIVSKTEHSYLKPIAQIGYFEINI